MKALFLIILLVTIHPFTFANTDVEASEPPAKLFSGESGLSVGATLSPINFPFPLATGLDATYSINDQWDISAHYLRSKFALNLLLFDVGEISEKSFTVLATRHFNEYVNVKFGLGKRNSQVQLAADLFDLVNQDYSNTLSISESTFIRLAVGSRWVFNKRYHFDVDWASVDIPIAGNVTESAEEYGDSEDDKKAIRNAESILKFYPGAASLKMSVSIII